MRITALVKHPQHVCSRYRIEAFRPALEAAGHTLTVEGWPQRWLERVRFFHRLRHTDALVLQRKLLPVWQLRLLRRRVRFLLFDFDDAIFMRNSYSAHQAEESSRLGRFRAMMQHVDAVLAGNTFLADHAQRAGAEGKVHFVPTCVDSTRYALASQEANTPAVRLVWVGSSSTIKGLEQIAGTLDELGKLATPVELKVVCDRSLTLPHLPVRFCPWTEATEAQEIAAAEIGIGWLPDDPWSAGKCGLKVLQYMAAGLPVVANPVGVQPEMIEHGTTGFLAATPAQWREAVGRLAVDAALRRRMGQAGRRLLEAKYDVPVGAAAWLRVLNDLETSTVSERQSA